MMLIVRCAFLIWLCREGDKCVAGPHKVTTEETLLLTADPQKLVTELNRDEFHRAVLFENLHTYTKCFN